MPSLVEHFKEVEAFERLKARGYAPRTIYDVGASDGCWSAAVSTVWPEARFHLFDPLMFQHQRYAGIRDVLAEHPNFAAHPVALGETDGEVMLSLTDDAWSSSVHPMGRLAVDQLCVPTARLDTYARFHNLPAPELLKADVQASEDAVLRGAGELLAGVDVILLETWLERRYGPKTPLLTELIDFLKPRGFTLEEFGTVFRDDTLGIYSLDALFISNRARARLSPA